MKISIEIIPPNNSWEKAEEIIKKIAESTPNDGSVEFDITVKNVSST